MNKIRELVYLIMFTYFFAFNYSCRKSCEPDLKENFIYNSEKNILPYKGGETLAFIDNITGDTINFYGDSIWTKYFETDWKGADCPIEIRNEWRKINYFSKGNVYNFQMFQTNYYFHVVLKNIELQTDFVSSIKTFDSLTIRNKIYYDVKLFSKSYVMPTQTNNCYYTNKNGIIKITSSLGDSLDFIGN